MLGDLQKARLACQNDPNYRMVCTLFRATNHDANVEFFWALQRKSEGRSSWQTVEGTCAATPKGDIYPVTRLVGYYKTKVWPEGRK